eukprot:CAMPEP_0172886338 /NCGR_PEP_ID=MMETSP1075-20121228/130701_1 /TAXON_ID=2916 /ORGANISM="Ceratium fusus, Strain PA161109" /LENGTH=79 /DNA_ID=CAMNT_0013739817 /DNA_START=30 /DNA_END=265 /DNA_ORIENTATION=-
MVQSSSVVLVRLALNALYLTRAMRISVEQADGLWRGVRLPPDMDDPFIFKGGELVFSTDFDDDEYDMYEDWLDQRKATA